MTRLLFGLVVAGLFQCPAARAQPPPDPVAEYLEAVAIVRAGRPSQATVQLLAHGSGWISEAVRRVCVAIRDRDKRLGTSDIQAAVLLHLEIFRLPGGLPSDRSQNLEAVRDLASAAGARLSKPFLRDCDLALVLALQRQLQVEDLVDELGLALTRFPDDPDLLLAKGSLWELLAALDDPSASYDINEATRALATRHLADGQSSLVDVQRPRIYEKCASVYERALRFGPQLHEARARLARVLVLTGKSEEAVRTLEPLLRADVPVAARTRYLALLFHGRAMAALGRADAATASYRAAGALFPGCPAARIALSTAVRAAGDQDGARELVKSVLSGDQARDCPNDPWWDYLPGQAWRLEALLAGLLAGVRQ